MSNLTVPVEISLDTLAKANIDVGMNKQDIADFMTERAKAKAKDALEVAKKELARLIDEPLQPDRKTAAFIKKIKAALGEDTKVRIVFEGYDGRKKDASFRVELVNKATLWVSYPMDPSNTRFMQRFNELKAIHKKIKRLENLVWRGEDAVFRNRCKAWIVETDLVSTAAGATVNRSLEDMVEAAINS